MTQEVTGGIRKRTSSPSSACDGARRCSVLSLRYGDETCWKQVPSRVRWTQAAARCAYVAFHLLGGYNATSGYRCDCPSAQGVPATQVRRCYALF